LKIQINARNGTHAYEVEGSDRLLHGGLCQGLGLPYECATGTCGTCKAKLVSGEIVDHWPTAPGRKYLKQEGEFLLCQCSAVGDLEVEVPRPVNGVAVSPPAAMTGTITRTQKLTRDVISIWIALPHAITFEAGQFALVRVPGIEGYRGWSMVNYAPSTNELEFVIKKKPDGVVSDWLFEADRAGTVVEVFGPIGHATFSADTDHDLLCIAGGSGIAGMMSILARAARDGYFDQHDGDVFFGVRTMRDAFFLDTFCRLREQCGVRLRVTIVFSDEAATPAFIDDYPLLAFDQGFVHEAAARSMAGRLQNIRAYLAGPPPAVDASLRLLLQARVSPANIRYDKFS
jgi:toluene monooxygenase electron transfer component